MNENEILNDKQFGFRAGHSTEHAILELIDQVSDAFDKTILPWESSLIYQKHLTLSIITFF